MDFVALLLFLAMQYLRPQEWSSAFNALRPVQVLALLSIWAMFQRKKPIRAKDLWSSPQDYVVTAYFVWTVYASPTHKDTWWAIFPLVFFYFIAVLTLNSLPRMKTFLSVWAASIVAVAVLALASTVGFDPFGSADLTNGPMKGRLVLNLSIFNNPNSLAHGLVPVIPMLFYLLFWKRVFAKPLLAIVIIPITAILMTLSKGAFVSGAVVIFATLTFGRPKTVQITMAVLAAMFGGTMLYALPRMNELRDTKNDEAIQGRVAAFTFGLKQMETLTYGHGLGNFSPNFLKYGPLKREKRARMGQVNGRATIIVTYVWVHYSKAPHSGYVQNGSDLGYTGFFIFIGILYTCLRTLVMAKTVNDEEELIRRTLFAVVLWYAVSSWMVDFCYRSTFFFLAAATSAFHRHLRGQFVATPGEPDEDAPELPAPAWHPEPLPAGNFSAPDGPVTIDVAPVSVETVKEAASAVGVQVEAAPSTDEAATATAPHGSINWQRLGLIDLGMTYLLTTLAIRFWRYLILNM